MPSKDPQVVVMRLTRIRKPDGRIITLTPGLKGQEASERIRSAVPMEKVKELKARGRVVEDTPPWP